MIEGKGNAGNDTGAAVRMAPAGMAAALDPAGLWQFRVYDPTLIFRLFGRHLLRLLTPDAQMRLRRHPLMRKFRTTVTWQNLVTTQGQNYLLDAGLANGTAIATWYLGLIDDSPTVAEADTLASHAGWAEVTAYDEANRVTWTPGAVASGSVDNSASQATFTISTDGTNLGGALLASDNTKGGTAGTLYAAGAFTGGDLLLNEGATVDVTATFSV